MASLRKKVIRGHPYYYAVWTARVDGRPRAVRQVYLGRADDIIRSLTERATPEVQAVRSFDFGALAGLLHVADRLKLLETLDRHLPRTRKGMPSTGTYLLLAALNRAVDPRSKRGFADWWKGTSLPRLFPKVRDKHLTSQRFWDAMDLVPEGALEAVEGELVARMRETEGLDLSCLLYDTTNFFTYIDTFNARPKMPQRGYSKAKRFDLRQVNLALLVTRDAHVPLFHKAYAGDRPDVSSFPGIFQEVTARYAELLREVPDVTLVFDKGQNAADNLSKVDEAGVHFVGSLVAAHQGELLDVPLSDYQPVPGYGDLVAHRARRVVLGRERTVVVTFNPVFHEKQKATLARVLGKARRELLALERRLDEVVREGRRSGRTTRQSVERAVETILDHQYLKRLLRVAVHGGAKPAISFTEDEAERRWLEDRLFGKTVLMTSRDDWPTEEIVRAYRGQAKVEEAFRRMKRPHFVSWSPMWHWTDQKIRVHAFYCVLALLLLSLLHREVKRSGRKLSIDGTMAKLAGIREVLLLGKGRRGRGLGVSTMLTERDRGQESLVELLGLREYAAGATTSAP